MFLLFMCHLSDSKLSTHTCYMCNCYQESCVHLIIPASTVSEFSLQGKLFVYWFFTSWGCLLHHFATATFTNGSSKLLVHIVCALFVLKDWTYHSPPPSCVSSLSNVQSYSISLLDSEKLILFSINW